MTERHRTIRNGVGRHRRLSGSALIISLLASMLVPLSADASPVSLSVTAAATDTPSESGRTEVSDTPAEAVPEEILAAEVEALDTAIDTGQPVIVEDATTETSLVTARPDGTFLLETSLEPERVEQDDEWVPVDTDLAADPDGTITPGATSLDVTFSGGGTGPFIILRDDAGNSLTYTWPAPLPAPILEGNTATYASVLPDVDLVVTVEADSYSEVLVVKNETAAQNPALSQINLGITGNGLTLEQSENGSMTATDADGKVQFTSPVPVMWDSTTNPRAGLEPTASEIGTGDVDTLDTNLQIEDTGTGFTGDLEITPPLDALTGQDVTYPVYIDPTMTDNNGMPYQVVASNGWNYGNNDNDDNNDNLPDYNLQVGRCNWQPECEGDWTARSYFAVDLAPITGHPTTAKIFSAEITLTQLHGGDTCGSQPVNLIRTNSHIGSNTTWPGPGTSVVQTVSAAGGADCPSSPAPTVKFNSATLVADIQGAANADVSQGTFGLKSPDEGNKYQWKQFGTNPKASIVYGYPPNPPLAVRISPTPQLCTGKKVVTTNQPEFTGVATVDNNGDPGIALKFEIYEEGQTGDPVRYSDWLATSSGTHYTWQSTATLPIGNYYFIVRAKSNPTDGRDVERLTPSAPYYFRIDNSTPTTTPVIWSRAYPKEYWGAPQNDPGAIALESGGSDIAGFTYAWESPAFIEAPEANECSYTRKTTNGGWAASGDNTARITPPTTMGPGRHTLYVRTFSANHRLSPNTASYAFYVSQGVTGTPTYMFEAETNAPTTTPAGLATVTETYDDASSDARRRLIANADGQKFSFPFAASVTADYAFTASLYRGNHMGKLQFSIQSTNVSPAINYIFDKVNSPGAFTFDGFDSTPSPRPVVQVLGGRNLPAGNYRFIIEVIGKNPGSVNYANPIGNGQTRDDNGRAVLLDFFSAVAINNVTYGSFRDAMNNNGISKDGVNQANIGPSASNTSLSYEALHAKDLAGGDTKTVGNATFTIPTANAAGFDNLIATGQTIPITPISGAQYVDLLVLATCDSIPQDPRIQLVINRAPPNISTFTGLTPIPNWTDERPATNPIYNTAIAELWTTRLSYVTTLDHINTGLTQDDTRTPKVYKLTAKINGGTPPTTITLPTTGTSLSNSCDPAIHVLAVTTSKD